MENYLGEYKFLSEKGFSLIRLENKNIEELIKGVIKAYKKVFNASSWGEGVKCIAGCDYKTTFELDNGVCPNCGEKTIDFYSNNEVRGFLEKVLSNSYYQALALIKDKEVGGFTWGWKTYLKDLNDQKLELSPKEFEKLIVTLGQTGFKPENSFYYQSETGVIPEFRNLGLGKALTGINQNILIQNKKNVSQILQRTSENSPMYGIRIKQGYKIVYNYRDEDKRIIFAKDNI